MAGEQAPPPLRFAQVSMSLGRILHSHLSVGRPPSRPFARERKRCRGGGGASSPRQTSTPYTDSPAPEGRGRRICKEAISSPGGKLPCEEIAANPAYTPPGSNEAREGLRALSRSPGAETPRSRKADIDPAPAAQRLTLAASQTTALIRRKADIAPAPAAQRPAPAASNPTAERRRFKG